MTGRPYVLAEATWNNVRTTPYEVAVLPWGATEPHNFHLPFGTDNYETAEIAKRAAEIAWDRGAKVVVLPGIPYGVNTGQLDLRLTINMNPSTQAMLLDDIVASLSAHRIPKLLILNGHGGNDFKQMIRELQPKYPVFISMINWYSCLDTKPYFDNPGDHAGQLETSVMQELEPDLVLPLADAGSGATKKFSVRGLREGWAWAPRTFSRISEDTGSGNPAGSSREKGAAYLEAVVGRIGGFLVELAALDLAKLYT
jgi:creatinine amidohydrolase